ncbi:M20/M25/M40 family metallo-hydrolase [Proteiniclasticum sp. C24MP]|uniref:M20/M25/M40 family metallo-hydrolase n=1 Tax=Proteiniclasticum sp. C24MP TaxID=3374101 RepID=UPI00375480EC
MKLNGDRIKELTLDLVGIRSVVGTSDENNVSERIQEILLTLPYFRENPEHLFYVENKDDPAGRKSLMAMVKGKKDQNRKTVVVIGHIDTVGTSDYGDLEDLATDPVALTEKFNELELPERVREDLESGNYLFGRGVLDMKSGVSILIHLLEEATREPENFSGNLVASFVSDEEGNSRGMLSCVPELVKLKKRYGLDYQIALDTDYTSTRTLMDPNRYLYAGTIGKLMPSFYIVGKETHVGDPFGGLDSNEIAAELTRRINLNVELSDDVMGEVTVPPVTLRLRDLKPEYSVQTNRDSYVYFNFATHGSTPSEVLHKLMHVANDAFLDVIEKLNRQYHAFTQKMNLPHKKLPWVSKVYTYDEVYDAVAEKIPHIKNVLDDYARGLMDKGITDEREVSLHLVKKLHGLWGKKDPMIILYFSPPYYPHMAVNGKNEVEETLIRTLKGFSDETLENPIRFRKFYPYISDLSYFSLPDEASVTDLRRNMPGFGISYTLPLEDIKELSLPVTNIGPYGFDAHQFTERIEVEYSFYRLPDLVLKTVLEMLK